MEKPLVNKKYLLEKYPGKGGWSITSAKKSETRVERIAQALNR